MNEPHPGDETLRGAFQSLAETGAGACSADDTALIWRAVDGTLDVEARRALVDRMAREPSLAEAWRLAHALAPRDAALAEVTPQSPRWTSVSWLAAAALVVIGLSGMLVVSQRSQSDGDTMRDGGTHVMEPLVATGTMLPRDAFQLRWRPGPEGSRYHVRVTGEDLRVLATAADLREPALRVDPHALATLRPGARVLWQVDVTLPTGARVTSDTFVVRVQ